MPQIHMHDIYINHKCLLHTTGAGWGVHTLLHPEQAHMGPIDTSMVRIRTLGLLLHIGIAAVDQLVYIFISSLLFLYGILLEIV